MFIAKEGAKSTSCARHLRRVCCNAMHIEGTNVSIREEKADERGSRWIVHR
jgi:hypothetical protein